MQGSREEREEEDGRGLHREAGKNGKKETAEERCLYVTDPAYPAMVRRIKGAPGRLYVRGRLPGEQQPAVAIVGARTCSSYGREMAEYFAAELAAAGVQIISGMAAGVDGIAQMAALEAGGVSFGVLGCGTDVCYPPSNRALYERLLVQGGILSEHPCGTPPLARHFPSRNRLISALADAVLVIEAKKRSGTLITVDFALEQGKEVYALPGRLTDELSRGCNSLLAQGAGLVLTPGELLELLPKRPAKALKEGQSKAGKGEAVGKERINPENIASEEKTDSYKMLSPGEQILLENMEERPIAPQELYERIKAGGGKMEYSMVLDALMSLAIKDLVRPQRGNLYQKKRGGWRLL